MPMLLRKLGVHGVNLPTKKSKVVEASDFSIGGMIGLFERKYAQAMSVQTPAEFVAKFGDNINSSWYGSDVVNTFFQNLAGQASTLWVKSHVGYTGTAIDAVAASATITDQAGLASALTLAADIRTKYLAHVNHSPSYHIAVDTNDLLTSPVASNLNELLTLVNELLIKYPIHEADSALVTPIYHAATRNASHVLTSVVAPTNLADCVSRLNDIKTKFNAHDSDTTAHTAGGNAHQVSATSASSTGVSTIGVQSAYQTITDYGTSGNRTGYKIVNAIRFSTTIGANVAASDTSATLSSVIGIKVGDIVSFKATGGTAAIVHKKITAISESALTVSWSGVFSAGSTTGVAGDVVEVAGFYIKTYRKSTTGIVSEVNTNLGGIICTTEPEVTDYYFVNVHATNTWIKVSDNSSASTLIESMPDENTSVTYLTVGADGTTATTAAHWSADLTAFDSLKVRFLANAETSTTAIQKAGESYCKGRIDTPIWISIAPDNQTKTQLQTLGSSYQRSDDVFQVVVADWLQISDPFTTAPNAPYRVIPNAGAVMGAWIRSIGTLGIHYVPCTADIALLGIQGIDNSNISTFTDQDRTDVASYGINLIQFISGGGYRIRNFFTPSTDIAFRHAIGILMRNYFKISAEDSLQTSENMPNSINRIIEDREAIKNFMYRIWFKGSTGNVPLGESYGQQQNADGSHTQPADHFEVIGDAVNNPQSQINLGYRNYQIYFTFPSPSISIEIGVGIMLR